MELLNGFLIAILFGHFGWWLGKRYRKAKEAKKETENTLYLPKINHLGELSMSTEDYSLMMAKLPIEAFAEQDREALTYKTLRPSFRRFLSPRRYRLDKEHRFAINSFMKNGGRDTELVTEMRRAVTAGAIFWGRYIPKLLFLPDAGSYKYFLLLLESNTESIIPDLGEVERLDKETDTDIDQQDMVLIGMMGEFMRRELYDIIHNLPHYYYRRSDNYSWPLVDVLTAIVGERAEFKYTPIISSPTEHHAFVDLMKREKIVRALVTACAAIYGMKIPKHYVWYSTLGRNLLLHFRGKLKITVPVAPPEPPRPTHLKVIK